MKNNKQNYGRGRGAGEMRRAGNRRSGGHHHVRKVEEGQLSDGCEYAFGISDDSNASSDGKIPVKIGGLPVTMIIDSGASCNVIGCNVCVKQGFQEIIFIW